MHATRRCAELMRRRLGALEADLFAHTEDEDDRVPELRAVEPDVLLRHRDRLADLHAERLGAAAARGAHADAQRRRYAAREPGIAGQEDAGDIATIGVDQGGLGLEQRQDKTAARAQAEGAVGVDRVDTEADLVHVRDDDYWTSPGALAPPRAHPEIAGRVSFCTDPTREQVLDRGSDRRLHA